MPPQGRRFRRGGASARRSFADLRAQCPAADPDERAIHQRNVVELAALCRRRRYPAGGAGDGRMLARACANLPDVVEWFAETVLPLARRQHHRRRGELSGGGQYRHQPGHVARVFGKALPRS